MQDRILEDLRLHAQVFCPGSSYHIGFAENGHQRSGIRRQNVILTYSVLSATLKPDCEYLTPSFTRTVRDLNYFNVFLGQNTSSTFDR